MAREFHSNDISLKKKKERKKEERENKWDIKRKEMNFFHCIPCIDTSFRVLSNRSNKN